MRKLLPFILASVFLTSTAAQASIEDRKVETVKSLYKDAKKGALYGNYESEFAVLYSYAGDELRDKIDLFEASEKNVMDYNSSYYGALNECGDTGFSSLRLTPGNSYSLEEVDDFDVKLLRNGNIRAILNVDGTYNTNNFGEPTDYRDFSVSCNINECRINDIVDVSGVSETNGIEYVCSL